MNTSEPVQARILLVEESTEQTLPIRQYLERHGLAVDHAPGAADAFRKLNRALPDLLITDLHLTGISGITLCRRLRLRVATRSIPVLLLTGDADASIEEHALVSGFDDYVRKSDPPELLLLRVRALLRKSHVNEIATPTVNRFASVKVLAVGNGGGLSSHASLLEELGPAGFRLRRVATGEEALTSHALDPFDVMVLDGAPPDMSGETLCRRMLDSRRTVDDAFMILALTEREELESTSALLAAGADDVLAKTRSPAVLRSRLLALVRRKLLFDENRQIAAEIAEHERALLAERAERAAAEARAALVEKLEQANRELRETQAQLVQSAKMASLGQLVAGIAHELNNPVGYVLAHLGTVDRLCGEVAGELAASLTPDCERRLDKIRRRVADSADGLARVRDLVTKLRTFSRLDEGEFKEASVAENLDAVLAMLRHRMKERIEVVRRIAPPESIPCYPGLLNQALMNVVGNAVDAIDGEGVIEITAEPDENQYAISVSDSGCGIPEADRERVFDPFFTTKPVGEGTGLGLAITYQIVRRHGGTIDIGRAAGRGTRVTLRLPLAGAPPPATDGTAHDARAAPAASGSER